MRGGSAFGPFGLFTNNTWAGRANFPIPMRKARKTAQAFLQNLLRYSERQRAGRGTGGVLRVVQPAQRTDAADIGDLLARATGRAHDHAALDGDAVGQRAFYRNPNHAPAGLLD